MMSPDITKRMKLAAALVVLCTLASTLREGKTEPTFLEPQSREESVTIVFPSEAELDEALRTVSIAAGEKSDLYCFRSGLLSRGHVIAPGAARFHQLRPSSGNGVQFSGSTLTNYFSIPYHGHPSVTLNGSSYVIGASIAWSPLLTKSSYLSDAVVAPSSTTPGLYDVKVSFSAGALDAMSVICKCSPGTNTATSYITDWAGVGKAPGDPMTFMEAVLVSDGVAYEPWSITSYLLRNDLNTQVVVAKGVSSAKATELVGLLGF